MDPSEVVPEPPWPRDLLPGIGPNPATRCLSDRAHRQVYLIRDSSGIFRVFKILRHQSVADLARFNEVRRRLARGPRCPWLLPVLAHGTVAEAGLAWEELALVDHADSGTFTLESYSPELLRTVGVGEESGLVERVASVGLELLRALEHLSVAGLVHGDVKPSNVFRHRSKWVLGDYDSVVTIEARVSSTASTEGYRPPGGGHGLECDTYALGKVLYELWTGNDRLEYPNLPPHRVSRNRWARGERLLNDLINALCSPVGLQRLSDLGMIRSVLMALVSGSEADQIRADRWISRRDVLRRRRWMLAGGASIAAVAAAWFWLSANAKLMTVHFQGEQWVAAFYRHPRGENDGYARPAGLGEVPALMLFNTHFTRVEPLRVGDRVELGLRKDAWRGHVGVYLSAQPHFRESESEFGHREHFGKLSHHLFFHVDGDEVIAPSAHDRGLPVALPSDAWTSLVRTNSLQTHWLSMTVGTREVDWSVQCAGLEIARGRVPRVYDPCYLGIYVYDNTLCYLRWVKIHHAPADGNR